jgi:hypothetical protein
MPVQFDPKLTLDGLMTLAGGALALIGVWWSNHQSTVNLQKQLDAEKAARKDDQTRHGTSVATALIAEINDFYQFSTIGLYERMKRWLPQGSISIVTQFPEFGALSSMPTIYPSVAHEVGSFGPNSVKSLISLYNYVSNFVDLYETYRESWRTNKGVGIDPILLQDIWDALPKLLLQSYETCELLAKEHGIRFDKSQFQIAGLDVGKRQLLQEDAMKITERLKRDLKASTYRLDKQEP